MATSGSIRVPDVGISGLAVYLPPYRVDLEKWCEWTGNNPDKIHAVVGRAFRMAGPDANVYTLAANAVLRLIRQYDIDPRRVGYLALGTESSSDNAAGTVAVHGLVNMALAAHGLPRLSGTCEVPEFKHACLGGVYALKGAGRYVALDGSDKLAIAVAADMAEYERGSSGEPTQGAGAVAMLVTAKPTLLTLDLAHAGSAAAYRVLDFRKPFLRFAGQTPGAQGRLADLPVFNGAYSTDCYTGTTVAALAAMTAHDDPARATSLQDFATIFMHRPYHRMPRNGLAMAWLASRGQAAQAGDNAARDELAGYCASAGVDLGAALAEWNATQHADPGDDVLPPPAYPIATALLRVFRKSPAYRQAVEAKLALGAEATMELGNLYTAALPVWLAAGMDAATRGKQLKTGDRVLLIGYGSGDAAEAIPAAVAEGWEAAAKRIDFGAALAGAVDLDEANYAALHDTGSCKLAESSGARGIHIDHIGTRRAGDTQDYGVAYYRYVNNT